MGHILATLTPVFAVLALGYALAKSRFISRNFLDELNRFVYYVALPALILSNLSALEALPAGTIPAVLCFLSGTLAVVALALLTARFLGLERWQYGTFIQGAYRGNLAFIGIPVLVYALRDLPEEESAAIIAQAILIFAPIMVTYNVIAVIVLVGSQPSKTGNGLREAVLKILKNPLILSALGGVTLFLLPIRLPAALANTLEFLGRVAAPCAVICVGGAMALVSMEGRYRSASFSALLKTGIAPVVIYLISLRFGLSPTTLLILMVFSATPSAVASYVMARQMGGDEAMASGSIVLSTLLSVISLALVVGMF